MKFDCYTLCTFVDFEISREKGDFLKTTICHLGMNGGSDIYCVHKRLQGFPLQHELWLSLLRKSTCLFNYFNELFYGTEGVGIHYLAPAIVRLCSPRTRYVVNKKTW